MNSISVRAARPYNVLIERGILSRAGELSREVHAPCTVAIITDDIVARFYGDTVSASFEAAGFKVSRFAFPNGEASKTLGTYENILDFLAETGFTRSDLIVALGGGVVGDLAGFAAATYQRGVGFIQIATTYLAAVDSSVGGKTGLNLTAGKNLCGAFYQPQLVIIDCDTFKTLPGERFADGAAETIKYGVIADAELFERVENGIADAGIDEMVSRCIQIKAQFVAEDEFDNGARRMLNFGHTFGHAIERCSAYKISHGHAVGIGMIMASRAARKMGLCGADCEQRIAFALEKNNLPLEAQFGAQELAAAMLGDKKRSGGLISLILPEKIGLCHVHDAPVSALGAIVSGGISAGC